MEIREHILSDGYRCKYRFYEGESRRAVLCIHGIQSHSGWFVESSEVLNRAGFSVLFPDRRGSGLNKAKRGDMPSWERLIGDVFGFMNLLRELTGVDKVHIVAISWGGKLALAIAKILPEVVKSFTLISPGIAPKVDMSVKTKMSLLRDILINPKRKYKIPLNEPELFTENMEKQKFIREDELKLTEATARFFYNSRRLDYFIKQITNPINKPMKLFLAGKDRIIDNCKTLEYYRAIRIGRGKKRLAFYPSASHTIEFEADNGEFLNELKEWILQCEE